MRIVPVLDVQRLSMFDLTKPVDTEIIIGSIAIIFILIGIGLGIVEYYKRRY